MSAQLRSPDFDAVLGDLLAVREVGIGRIRGLGLSALADAASIGGFVDEDVPAGITLLLKQAVDALGGGSAQDAAEYSLGLYPGTALWKNVSRRLSAAEAYGSAVDTFRKNHERPLLAQVAESILVICQEGKMRAANIEMQAQRHPADSRLAVQWIERFEAYYRIWTPAYALAADLDAAIDTYLEEPTPHPPWAPDSDVPYDRDAQARGYGRSALYRLAEFWLEMRRFMHRHGGMWLFSDPQVEEKVSDAVYRIGWHNSLSDRDESFLRRHLADSRHEEPAQFWDIIQAFKQGNEIDANWQQMILDAVPCVTDEQKAGSQAWLTIQACRDYCRLVDEDWLRIADWYRPGYIPNSRFIGRDLYKDLVDRRGQSPE